jgi:hypothetical protein
MVARVVVDGLDDELELGTMQTRHLSIIEGGHAVASLAAVND